MPVAVGSYIMKTMAYRNCPHCGASNRSTDSSCYSCTMPIDAAPAPGAETEPPGPQSGGNEVPHISWPEGILAVALSMLFGGALGYGISILEMEMPFLLEEVLLGALCASVTAWCLSKFQELPEGLAAGRIVPATAYGALVGLCLYAIWWTFDPSAGFVVIGAIAGFCSGLPVAVSYGLGGGENRALGSLEFMNVFISIGVGLALGVFLSFELEEFYLIPGVAGLLGLIPTALGGRLNLNQILQHMSSE